MGIVHRVNGALKKATLINAAQQGSRQARLINASPNRSSRVHTMPQILMLFKKVSLLIYLGIIPACLDPGNYSEVEVEVLAPPYPRARCAKGAANLGNLYPQGTPIAKATVILLSSGLEQMTDEAGKAHFKLVPEGDYQIQADAPGYQRRVKPTQTMGSKTVSSVQLQLDPCIQVISSQGHFDRVGFNARVEIEGHNLCGADWEDVSYTWSQIEGPDVRSSSSTWNGSHFSFTTRKLEELRSIPTEAQMLSFSHDEAGEYVFQLTAQNKQGAVSKSQAMVTSTNVATGVNNGTPFQTYYFVGDKQGPWDWQLDNIDVEQGGWPPWWPVHLVGANNRIFSIQPVQEETLPKHYEVGVRNTIDGPLFIMGLLNWNLTPTDCGRSECHASLQSSWEGTRHAFTWRRLLNGDLSAARGATAESCATCHSLGYDRTVSNGGYDDIADINRVSFPRVFNPGNYEKLPEPLREVSNIYCSACHGPSRVADPKRYQINRFQVGVCATCHDRKPEQDLVAQWQVSRMSQTIKNAIENGADSRTACAKCHTGNVFYYTYYKLTRAPSPFTDAENCCELPAPITCQICHSPMYANNKAQVFEYGSVKTTSGLHLENVGSGALCSKCHNTEHNIHDPKTLKERLAPHSPQADLSYGQAGYDLGPKDFPPLEGIACARDAGEGCVTCHMDKGPLNPNEPGYRQMGDHTFRMTSKEGLPNTRPCQSCHAGRQSFNPRAIADFDGDGQVKGVREEIEGLMNLLKTTLKEAIATTQYTGCLGKNRPGAGIAISNTMKIVVVDQWGYDLGDCNRNGLVDRQEQPYVFPNQDLLLHQAAYNYLLIERDKSWGLHNFPYAIKLLQRTIYALRQRVGKMDSLQWTLHQ